MLFRVGSVQSPGDEMRVKQAFHSLIFLELEKSKKRNTSINSCSSFKPTRSKIRLIGWGARDILAKLYR